MTDNHLASVPGKYLDVLKCTEYCAYSNTEQPLALPAMPRTSNRWK